MTGGGASAGGGGGSGRGWGGIDLGLGNPDLEPPEPTRLALATLAAEATPGLHRYTDNAGLPGVRAFVAHHLSRSAGVGVGPDQVFLTGGASAALVLVLTALLDPGDEVVLVAPYFPEYLGFVRATGATPVVARAGAGLRLDVEGIGRALSPRTRALILNDPNNPTGLRASAATLDAVAALLATHHRRTGARVHVVSDEACVGLAYDAPPSAEALSRFEAAWLVRSASKDFSLPGERIGFLAWGPSLHTPHTLPMLRAAARALGHANAPALMQRLLPTALLHPLDPTEYRRRCGRFLQRLAASGIDAPAPQAGFFVFPRAPGGDDRAFCEHLARAGVRCLPGAAFGAPGFFRAALCHPWPVLEQAAEILTAVARDTTPDAPLPAPPG